MARVSVSRRSVILPYPACCVFLAFRPSPFLGSIPALSLTRRASPRFPPTQHPFWPRSTTLNRPDVRPKYSGILNGIDIEAWNPTADPTIPAPFSPEVLTTKALCKKYLQRGLGLAENPNAPLFVCITRLVSRQSA